MKLLNSSVADSISVYVDRPLKLTAEAYKFSSVCLLIALVSFQASGSFRYGTPFTDESGAVCMKMNRFKTSLVSSFYAQAIYKSAYMSH
jgi:hypothetical protein